MSVATNPYDWYPFETEYPNNEERSGYWCGPLSAARPPCCGVSHANVTAVYCRHWLTGSSSTTNPSSPCIWTWAAPSSWLSIIPMSDWIIRKWDKSVTGPSGQPLPCSLPLMIKLREVFLTVCSGSSSVVWLWLLWNMLGYYIGSCLMVLQSTMSSLSYTWTVLSPQFMCYGHKK